MRILCSDYKLWFLSLQVVLIFGISGACRTMELTNLTIENVEKHNKLLLIKLPNTKTKIDRSFVVHEEFAKYVEKYQALRPENMNTNRFFLNYSKGRCHRQVIGKNKFAGMPKQIATYLKLKNVDLYTGHCFRRTSATLLADSGANLSMLKRHGGWKSSKVAEGYIEESVENKSEITTKITENINLKSPRPSTSTESFFTNVGTFSTVTEENINQPPLKMQEPQVLSSQTHTQTVNIPKKNLAISFTNCSHFTINFH